MSLNGMIARKDGDEDFLSNANWRSFSEMAKQHGCFIVGRKTYEIVQKWPDYNFSDIDAKLKIIVSGDANLELQSPFRRAGSPMEAIKIAKAENISSVTLVGGSSINSAFMAENLVDEVILNVEPAIIGEGIPIFAESKFDKRLSFVDATKIADDILQIKYKVIK